MASNFSIFFHRNSDNLYLKLMGDFDGSSAHQLINILKEQNGNVNKISDRLTFTGEYSDKMALEGRRLA